MHSPKTAPLLSIVINNFNYSRYLPAAIDSALAQTYPNTEVVVVDDGSTDDSPVVIAAYAGRIRPVLKPNGGQASAVNAGFERSCGDVVIFLDADDVLEPGIGARVVAEWQSQPNTAKVQYRMDIIDIDGRPTGGVKPEDHLPRRSGDLRSAELTAPFDMAAMSMSGNAFPRAVLDQIMPVPESAYPMCASYYLSHLTPFFGSVLFLDDVGASYRIHDANNYIASRLAVHQVRQSVIYMRHTLFYIGRTAERTGLLPVSDDEDRILSFAYIAQRMISLKLEPHLHPIKDESAPRLIRLGLAALRRRVDVPIAVKISMFIWLVSMAVSPVRFAGWLAQQMTVPHLRSPWLNRALGAAHRRHASALQRATATPCPR